MKGMAKLHLLISQLAPKRRSGGNVKKDMNGRQLRTIEIMGQVARIVQEDYL